MLQTTVEIKSWQWLWQKKRRTQQQYWYVNLINTNFAPLFLTLHWIIQAKEIYKTALFPSRLTWWKFQQNKMKAFVFFYSTITNKSYIETLKSLRCNCGGYNKGFKLKKHVKMFFPLWELFDECLMWRVCVKYLWRSK